MNLYEEDLENRLRRLQETEQAPRPEFVTYLDEKLQKEANALKRRLQVRRVLGRITTAAVVVFFGGWLGVAQWQQQAMQSPVPPAASSNPATAPGPEVLPSSTDNQPPAVSTVPPNHPLHDGPLPPTGLTLPSPDESVIVPQQRVKQRDANEVGPASDHMPAQQYGQIAATSTQSQASSIATAAGDKDAERAQSYMQQMLGEDSGQYALDSERSDAKAGAYVFSRKIHGIPYDEDHYTVKVKQQEVSSFQFQHLSEKQRDIANFPLPADLLPADKAAAAIAATMHPVYRTGENDSLSLRYEPSFPGYLDAKTGVPLNSAGQPWKPLPKLAAIPINAEGIKLETSSLADTIALLQEQFGVRFDELGSKTPGSISSGEVSGSTYTWKENGRVITAKVNASGRLIAYHVQSVEDGRSGQKLEPRADLQKAAIQHLQRYLDKSVEAVQLLGTRGDETELHYQFGIVCDGLPVIDRVYDVALDRSGRVIGMAEERMAMPKNPLLSIEADSRDAAVAAFLQQARLELVYLWPKAKQSDKNGAAMLVYQLKKS